jgi:tripartite-type tricarboxylate transporter receptor subunit TctC
MKKMLFIGMLVFATGAHAQTYPNKPVRLVVPFAPGGSSTIVARSVASEMEKGLGQSIVIENKGGGGGNPAMQDVARADPDGYTLLITHIGSLALNPYLYSSLPFDVNRDFVHISLLAKVPNIFVVHESVPAKDAREFVALAKKEPGKYYYGSAGNGSAGHLAMEYFKLVSGIELQHVPYKGTGPNLVDLVAGRTHATSAGTPPLMPHVKAGKLRDRRRLAQATVHDSGGADHRRAGLRRLRDFAVVRPVRAREDAARGDPAPGGGGSQGGEEPCGGRALQGR